MSCWTVLKSTPAMTSRLANVWRKQYTCPSPPIAPARTTPDSETGTTLFLCMAYTKEITLQRPYRNVSAKGELRLHFGPIWAANAILGSQAGALTASKPVRCFPLEQENHSNSLEDTLSQHNQE
jgi:hypothetical protein